MLGKEYQVQRQGGEKELEIWGLEKGMTCESLLPTPSHLPGAAAHTKSLFLSQLFCRLCQETCLTSQPDVPPLL